MGIAIKIRLHERAPFGANDEEGDRTETEMCHEKATG